MVAGNINTLLAVASSNKAYNRIRSTGLYFTTQNAFKAPPAQAYVKQLFDEAPQARNDVEGKLAIVTGVTVGGAGYHMAEELALQAGMDCIIMGRNEKKLKAAVASIKEEAEKRQAGAPTMYEIKYDLDSLESATQAAMEAIKIATEKYDGKLHVLMNNAGAFYPTYGVTKEGVESNTGRNFLAPHVLTEKLLPALRKAATSTYKPRVVHVASLAHCCGQDFDPKRLVEAPAEGGAPSGIFEETEEKKLDYSKATGALASAMQYGRAKMAVLAECIELAKRESTLAVVALHPGSINSNFGAGMGVGAWIYYNVFGPFQFSPSQGARAALRGCLDPDLNTGALPSGSYLHSDGNPWVPEEPTTLNPATGKVYTMDDYAKATFDAAEDLVAKISSKQ
ncbi:Dehydrogenase [Seminavis robusta]|uniref:Dehydrogenase n=1 Tax=Seminavis robusta TaxID=568900 RepID=A0A9N8EEG7_9STRA|nr:Dehydrogenase [Seminavis robusta]|eukprot:Sro819_g207140.1 Dehydrogenase (395) ;mRNA; r:33701-34885